MVSRNNDRGFSGMGVVYFLLGGLGIGVALARCEGRSRRRSSSPRTLPARSEREARPISADLVTAIRNADARVVRKLLDDGADVNARDTKGNTPLILACLYSGP